VFERSLSKSSPLEKTRSKLANPVELSWGLAGVSTGVASFDGDLRIGIVETGFTLNGQNYSHRKISEILLVDLSGSSCGGGGVAVNPFKARDGLTR